MKHTTKRHQESTTTRNGRSSLSPYLLDEIGLTRRDLARERGSSVVVVAHQQ